MHLFFAAIMISVPISANSLSVLEGPYCVVGDIELMGFDDYRDGVRIAMSDGPDDRWIYVANCSGDSGFAAILPSDQDETLVQTKIVEMIASNQSYSFESVSGVLSDHSPMVLERALDDDSCVCSGYGVAN